MNIEELKEAYKNGMREFDNLDLDGDLSEVDLSGSKFSNCFFSVNFSRANLSHTTFKTGNVKTCDFREADLSDAHLEELAIESTIWTGAKVDRIFIKNLYCYSSELQKVDFLQLIEELGKD